MKKLFFTLFAFCALLSSVAQQRHFDTNYPDVHDPVMAQGEDGRYYVFSTGMGVGVMSSPDLQSWREEPGVFKFVPADVKEGEKPQFSLDREKSTIPSWAMDTVPGYMGHTWAPDISYHNGQWLLYYSCSTFGKNGSAIGLATNKTLDPLSPDYKWEDQGLVIASHKGKDNWNAIDPNLITDASTGQPYLVYGSFWDGIQIIELSSDFKTPISSPRTLARRIERHRELKEIEFTIENGRDTIEAGDNAIEAPFMIYNDGYYYLFVSWDYCCRGKNSTYKTVYGRSRSINGPFLDKQGKDMAFGGGTMLVGPSERYYGIGHNSAYNLYGQWYFLCHAYDAEVGARAKMFLRKMYFDKDGWITLVPL